jgi:hypothetical protein
MIEALYGRDIGGITPPKPGEVRSSWHPWSWKTDLLLKVLQGFTKFAKHPHPIDGVVTPWFYLTSALSHFSIHIEVCIFHHIFTHTSLTIFVLLIFPSSVCLSLSRRIWH